MAKDLTKASIIRLIVIEKLKRGLIYFILVGGCIVFLYPIFYAVGVGFMSRYEFAAAPPSLLPIPQE